MADAESIFRQAVSNNSKVKIVGRLGSTTRIICTSGTTISTEYLDQVIKLDEKNKTVTVEPGITIGQLAAYLDQYGLSLGYQLTGYNGITVGGAVAVGAHGSSMKHSSVLSSSVTGVTLLNGVGKEVKYHGDNAAMKAIRANLGALGFITSFTLKVQPAFNLAVNIDYPSTTQLFDKQVGVLQMVNHCDFGEMLWFPNQNKLIRVCGNQTSNATEKDARSQVINPLVPALFTAPAKQFYQLGACYNDIDYALEKMRYLQMKLLPPLSKGALHLPTRHAIGKSYSMMTAPLVKGYLPYPVEWTYAVPEQSAQSVINYLNYYFKQHHIALPLTGVFMRYTISEDKSYMADTASGGAFKKGSVVLMLDLPVYSPVGWSAAAKAQYEQDFLNLSKYLVKTYSVRLHWGKNVAALLTNPVLKNAYGANLVNFTKQVRTLDPRQTFSNRFTEQLLTPNSDKT